MYASKFTWMRFIIKVYNTIHLGNITIKYIYQQRVYNYSLNIADVFSQRDAIEICYKIETKKL